ncbi:CBS domain-containing protein [Melittangium boletus]|uniref:CBS domain-containing protein n=1 Tax=Melittangium boletus DSM 14713 TaxID=1294270 RepID=A0A250IIK6_9BACT|nr:CBS domain-containing protein [Melittangium boletus]ATB30987.1 CBS domain-containing protein [Melittangium boletus DSM 14713]
MRIRDVMTPDALSAPPETTLMAAAEMMRLLNVDVLPVVEEERVVGILSDRAIVVRGLALGHDPRTVPICQVMSLDVETCSPEEDEEDVARRMRQLQVHRLLVVDDQRRLLGTLHLDDLVMERVDSHQEGRAPAEDDGALMTLGY